MNLFKRQKNSQKRGKCEPNTTDLGELPSIYLTGLCRFKKILKKELKDIATQKNLAYFLLFLLLTVSLPFIGEASVSDDQIAEFKVYSEPLDPIKAGQMAMNLNKFVPQELYIDPDKVVLEKIVENESLTLGQQLALNGSQNNNIPERVAPTYTVQDGETAITIAEKFNLHVGTIMDVNDLDVSEIQSIKEGTELKIPSSDSNISDEWLMALNNLEKEKKKKAAQEEVDRKVAQERAQQSQVRVQTSARGSSSIDISVIGSSYEQCVPWARANSGVSIHGYAGSIAPSAYEPRVGAVALDRFFGHASVVVSVESDSIVVHEANWIRGKITERRVSKDAIRGYVY